MLHYNHASEIVVDLNVNTISVTKAGIFNYNLFKIYVILSDFVMEMNG